MNTKWLQAKHSFLLIKKDLFVSIWTVYLSKIFLCIQKNLLYIQKHILRIKIDVDPKLLFHVSKKVLFCIQIDRLCIQNIFVYPKYIIIYIEKHILYVQNNFNPIRRLYKKISFMNPK